ncbi:MAG: sigma-70 family RNA polymerase sigma factor [Polyangiales bacterium]
MAKQAAARKTTKVSAPRAGKVAPKARSAAKAAKPTKPAATKASAQKAANANGRAQKAVKPTAHAKAQKPAAADEKKAAEASEEENEVEAADMGRDFEPSPEQLEKEEAETKRALKDMERHSGGDSTLSRYFREMANHRVLTPAEEVEAAQTVERLEIGYWEALFSYPPAFETVACVLDVVLPEPVPELAVLRKMAKGSKNAKFTKRVQDKWDKVATGVATKLRELDGDRLYVADCDAAVHRLAGKYAEERDLLGEEVRVTAAFKQYLDGVDIARLAQKRSKNRFVAANLRLVVSIARRYNRGRLPLIDLIQEGNIGLMKAVERFDHNRGYRFSTYASWWIRHAISRALADKGRAVRIPVHMLDTYNRVARATQAIATRTGKEPTPEELEAETGIAADKLEKIKGYWAETPFSLDRPVNDEDGRKFIDFLEEEDAPSPLENLSNTRWSDEVQRLLETLTPMEARILRWRFGLNDEDELTLKEIGDKYNLSRERIRQLQEQALTKIRRQIKE